jgi:rubrerythrin
MASLRGSKTEKNLLAAFAGESQARNRYSFFSSAARKEGYVQIANIFAETAENEKEHAKLYFKLLEGGDVEIQAAYPAGTIGTTTENLAAAAAGEKLEWTELYPGFGSVAEGKGFSAAASAFRHIAEVEYYHEMRYNKLLDNIKSDRVWKRDEPVKWKCANCGRVHEGLEPPELCPSCLRPRGYFELWTEPY